MDNGLNTIVSLESVTVDLNGQRVLEDVNLSIKEKDFLGVIGPNGGGKTTLLKVILGLIKPVTGEVTVFFGKPEDARRDIGYVPQVNLFDRSFPLTVFDAVLMGRIGKAVSLGYFKSYDRDKAAEALRIAGMSAHAGRQIGKLSEGQKQRVFIARALVSDPKLLLLDEPTASVDPTAESEFYGILNELRDRMAVVLVSHDIGVISRYIDKIACLNRRLYFHDSKEIKKEDLEAIYQCPVDMIAHGVPHRVMEKHGDERTKDEGRETKDEGQQVSS